MIYHGTQDLVVPCKKIQANLIKYSIHGHTLERGRSKKNPAEGVIRELRKSKIATWPEKTQVFSDHDRKYTTKRSV